MFDTIHKDEIKFGSIDNNFNFKVIIFYDKYKHIGLLTNFYINDASIMLFSQIQMHFYANYSDISIFN